MGAPTALSARFWNPDRLDFGARQSHFEWMKDTSTVPECTGVTEDELFEMANILPEESGLTRRVWISINVRQQHHRPRLKVEGSDNQFYPVAIDDPIEFLAGWAPGWSAAQFQSLQRFIELNRNVLLEYWNDRIGTRQALNDIRPI